METSERESAANTPLPLSQQEPVEIEDPGLQALRVIRHDFKTPLTSLKMLGQIFKVGLEQGTLTAQPERAVRNCRMLIEQVDRLVELADNLYEISVVQSGRLQLERQLADLRPVIQNAITRHADRIAGCDMPEEPIWGQWDTARLLQAFSHLITEGQNIVVTARTDTRAGLAHVTFSGDFRPVTEKTSPGRYVARVIIEQHGGTLSNRFEVALPLAPTSR